MSASLQIERDRASNPLDILEQIIAANEWAFERRSDGEMAAEAPGKWCDYGLHFSWSHEISAMAFTCAFDLKVPADRRDKLYELLALANDRLWIGHFGIEVEDGVPVFRHSVLLRGSPSVLIHCVAPPSALTTPTRAEEFAVPAFGYGIFVTTG